MERAYSIIWYTKTELLKQNKRQNKKSRTPILQWRVLLFWIDGEYAGKSLDVFPYSPLYSAISSSLPAAFSSASHDA